MICHVTFILPFDQDTQSVLNLDTVKPLYKKPLHNEDTGITSHIFQPSYSKMYGKGSRHNQSLL